MNQKEVFTEDELVVFKRFGLVVVGLFKYTSINNQGEKVITEGNYIQSFDNVMERIQMPYAYGYVGDKYIPEKEDEWDIVKDLSCLYCSKIRLTYYNYKGKTLITPENFEDKFLEFKSSFIDKSNDCGFMRLTGKISSEYNIYDDEHTGKIQEANFDFISSIKNGERYTEKYNVLIVGEIAERFIDRYKVGDTVTITVQRLPHTDPKHNLVGYVSFESDSKGRKRDLYRQRDYDEGR